MLKSHWNWSIFWKRPWAIAHVILSFDFNTSSERPLSKLSVIGQHLWPFKDALFNSRSPSFRVGSVLYCKPMVPLCT